MTASSVKLTIDGREVEVPAGTTIYDAAARLGIKIPILCHREHLRPVAVCRACVVDVGARTLAPACYRPVEPGMKVQTHHSSEKVRGAVKTVLEMLLADTALVREKDRHYGENELDTLARQFDLLGKPSRFARQRRHRPKDDSSLVIAVDHDACILCDRCVRACNEVRQNNVIGRAGKGSNTRIAFDLDDPMGNSSCVACGECMVSCPTGALTHRGFVKPDITKEVQSGKQWSPPRALLSEELAQHPLFEGVSRPFLNWNEGSVVRRYFRKGEVICREGEFGSTAYYIEHGKVDIYLASPIKHVKGRKNRRSGDRISWGPLGLFRRFRSVLLSSAEDHRLDESQSRSIPVDAPVALSYDAPRDTLEPGQIFGEMACMNNSPRSATVRAAEDTIVLEMLRNVVDIARRNKRWQAVFDELFGQRAIENFIKSVPLFTRLLPNPDELARFLIFLQVRMELLRLNPGEVIFKQGDKADDFYLVRLGFVKVTQSRPGGEHVLNYLGPGSYFGEIGLLAGFDEVRDIAPHGVRTATCTALDHVDLFRVRGQDFNKILRHFPDVRDHLVKEAVQTLCENEREIERLGTRPIGEFLDQGLMEAQSLLVLDLEKCTRCDECTKACADAHDGVTRLIREGLRFDKYLVASSCRSCLDPYCLPGCPVGSIRRTRSLEILIEDWCIGCGKCAENCPYGNINMHPFKVREPDPQNPQRMIAVVRQKATTCDLCSDLDGQPSCVYACPHDAAHRMSGAELLQIVTIGGQNGS